MIPRSAKEVELTEITRVLKEHYNPAPLEIAESFHFGTRVRKEGESIADFIVALKKLSIHCKFGVYLNRALRDRFVCGLNYEKIQNRLLNTADLTFKLACETARAMEMSEQQAKEFVPGSAVHKVDKQQPWKRQGDTHGNAQGNTQGNTQGNAQSKARERCRHCNSVKHQPSDCRWQDATCYKCQQRGHIVPACKTTVPYKDKKGKTHVLEDEVQEDSSQGYPTSSSSTYSMFSMTTGRGSPPWKVTVCVNGVNLEMEVNSGGTFSVMGENQLSMWGSPLVLQPSAVKLRTFTGEVIIPKGEAEVKVEYGGQTCRLPLLVTPGKRPALLGRNWLSDLRLNWKELAQQHQVHQVISDAPSVKDQFPSLFREEPGKLKGFKAHVEVEPNAAPIFIKPRPVSYYMRSKLDAEYKRLQDTGIVEPVRYARWASPAVPVLKRDGSVRVCGDYKVTVNKSLRKEVYPLPTPDDLFTKLEGGVRFAKLDLSHAYQQVELDEESQELLVLNTHQGLLRYKRLNFGVASAPAIFQRAIEGLLQGAPMTAVFLDDVIVTGKTQVEYDNNLLEVLTRLSDVGLTLKESKCEFGMKEVQYLGYQVSSSGLEPQAERIQPVMDAPAPTCVSELKSYLGMLTYYNRFLPNVSTVLEPLHELLRTGVEWEWNTERDRAFKATKEMLEAAPVLTHYDLSKPMVLSCDASPYGVGAVLSHISDSGQEMPVAFASRKLNACERRYSQLDKEGLSVVFGVCKFHKYLEGRKFRIQTDHKPLLGLLGADRPIPVMSSPRVQRWAVTLAGYTYDLVYRRGVGHGNADCMSRLPAPGILEESPVPADVVLTLEQLDTTTITSAMVREWTRKDPVLAQVVRLLEEGWPDTVKSEELSPYYHRRTELSLQDGCVLWGARVLIPAPGRAGILQELHVATLE